jgi:hypothetical protein
MRLMLDLTACQSASRGRGLGRYASSVVLAMLAHAGRHDVWLAANVALPETYEDLRVRFGRHVAPGRLAKFYHPRRSAALHDLAFENCAPAAAFRSV